MLSFFICHTSLACSFFVCHVSLRRLTLTVWGIASAALAIGNATLKGDAFSRTIWEGHVLTGIFDVSAGIQCCGCTSKMRRNPPVLVASRAIDLAAWERETLSLTWMISMMEASTISSSWSASCFTNNGTISEAQIPRRLPLWLPYFVHVEKNQEEERYKIFFYWILNKKDYNQSNSRISRFTIKEGVAYLNSDPWSHRFVNSHHLAMEDEFCTLLTRSTLM